MNVRSPLIFTLCRPYAGLIRAAGRRPLCCFSMFAESFGNIHIPFLLLDAVVSLSHVNELLDRQGVQVDGLIMGVAG